MDSDSWENIYHDLPSKQMKVCVANKSLVICSEDEMRALQPEAMQAELDDEMGRVTQGRCFVRPSGTEDVVRIYAEAENAADAAKLAEEARTIIMKYLND
jgi:phosphoacetylglucosamine mutase